MQPQFPPADTGTPEFYQWLRQQAEHALALEGPLTAKEYDIMDNLAMCMRASVRMCRSSGAALRCMQAIHNVWKLFMMNERH
jgi:hypothetical protein